MSTYAKYAELHKLKMMGKDHSAAIVDRNAYMTYLEAQLERVTTACLTVQAYDERLDQMAAQITSSEERSVNLTRLVKLLQSCADNHDEEIKRVWDTIHSGNLPHIASKSDSLSRSPPSIQLLEKRIGALEEQLRKGGKSATLEYVDNKQAEMFTSLAAMESKFEKMIERQGTDIAADVEKIEKQLEGNKSSVPIKEASSWSKNVEEQLSTIKHRFGKNVEATEIGRLQSMLEEEIERRELGDNKAMEIATKAEELCARLGEEILVRVRELETETKEKLKSVQIDEILNKQKIEFEILQKSLKSELAMAIDDLHAVINSSTRVEERNHSLAERASHSIAGNLGDSFGARREQDSRNDKEGVSSEPDDLFVEKAFKKPHSKIPKIREESLLNPKNTSEVPKINHRKEFKKNPKSQSRDFQIKKEINGEFLFARGSVLEHSITNTAQFRYVLVY